MSRSEPRHTSQLDDPGADLIDKVTSLWDQYGRIGLGILAAVAVIVAGAWFMMRASVRRENEASGKLAESSAKFWQGDYDGSIKEAQDVAKQYGSTTSGQLAHVLAGDNAFWKGDWKTATTEYQAYLAKNRSGLVASTARRSLAYSLESAGRYDQAAKLFDELVGSFDRTSSAEFLMASARCLMVQGKRPEALTRVERVVKEFGETRFASRARVLAAELSPPKPE